MKITKLKFLFLSFILINSSCIRNVRYLDHDYPGLTPKKYAEGTINVNGRFLQSITMSPDGEEQFLTQTDSVLWRYERILRVRDFGSDGIRIDTPRFVKDFKYERLWFIGEPTISPDNKNLYFIADFPPDYWHAQRTPTGDWSAPQKMDSISTQGNDWYISVSKNKTLYCTDGLRIFKSQCTNGKYLSRTKMDAPFNEESCGDPCISPNGDYMVFVSDRKGGSGQGDLYVSFNDDSGNWSNACNLGPGINTEYMESAPYISPDEKFLFFSRRDKGEHANFQDIYWVSLKVLDQCKRENQLKKIKR